MTEPAADASDVVEQAVFSALNSPFRRAALLYLMERNAPCAPIDYVKELGPRLPNQDVGRQVAYVAYHFRVLAKAGLIELVDAEPRRGAVKHIYRPKKSLRKELRELVAAIVEQEESPQG